ncbi:TPA: SGNH/GDSL hydrolase family protein [Aeromonas hydrophila]|nr:phosphatidylcholine-sterol acyltransferase [Aeromonas hydrophila]TNI67477.1 phosphatidylcholine-sterol acyltransferase [Aeromonas hydrophila]HAU4874539.1 SGNH/GDSL hydrolase family protein [Aeromonas hydrophila]HAU4919021.1 SGNH/GDSL hydrolase family protein [Aeromonas hydrophila]
MAKQLPSTFAYRGTVCRHHLLPTNENNKMKKWFVCLLGLFALTVQAADSRPAFSRIVMFGDSLSDTGKMYSKMRGYLPSSPPYYQGRFSNGPVWLEQLTQQFPGLTIANEAEGGATAVAYNKISWNPKYQVINNLDYEVTQFLQKDSFKPDDLVILWVGANDYLAYGWNTEQDAKRVRDAISDAANRMVLNGAKQILLFNLPDLGQNPSARSQKVVEAASHVSAYHNQLLLNLARQLAPTGIVKLFEIDKQFAEMLREPQNFGLSDTENACYGGGYVWKPFASRSATSVASDSSLSAFNPQERLAIAGNPLLAQAVASPMARRSASTLDCEGKMFWDQVHPTTVVHAALSERAGAFIEAQYEFLAH